MAILGNGQGIDVSFKAGGSLKTSTAQYRVVGMQGATSAADWTVYLTNNATALSDTGTSRYAIGINQSYMSAGSEACNVRMLGLSKAICAGSITAGDFVKAYEGASTTSRFGTIVSLLGGVTISAATASLSVQNVVLGRALEDGSTETVITIFVNPQLYDNSLMVTSA